MPILYRNRTRDTARLSMEKFPLGLIAGGCYTSQRVTYSSRDLFLMLTHGISEVPNEKDEEFGLRRLEQLLTRHAAQRGRECRFQNLRNHKNRRLEFERPGARAIITQSALPRCYSPHLVRHCLDRTRKRA